MGAVTLLGPREGCCRLDRCGVTSVPDGSVPDGRIAFVRTQGHGS